MATYKILEQSTKPGGRIEYLMEIGNEGVALTYSLAQTQETLDAKCDSIVAQEAEEAAKQAKIDKAIAEALWTDEERANLG